MANLNDPTQPTGLVGVPLKTNTTGYNPSTAGMVAASSTGYNPTATEVTKPQTVQGQISDIIAADSPLMQQAQRRSMEQMAGRGLLNSSIAVGAGQSALYDAAMPIAQQDATTHFTANQKTVDAKNAEANFRAAAANQASLQNSSLGTDINKSNAAAENAAAAAAADSANQAFLQGRDITSKEAMQTKDIGAQQAMQAADIAAKSQLASLDRATQVQLKQLDIGSQQQLTQMENQYRQLLQANQNASAMYQQTVQNIANISIQPNLSMESKDAAIATQINSLREALAATSDVANRTNYAVTSLNLGQYFNAYSPTNNTDNVNVTAYQPTNPSQTYDPNRPGGLLSSQEANAIAPAIGDFLDGAGFDNNTNNLSDFRNALNKAKGGDQAMRAFLDSYGIDWRTVTV